MPCQKNALPPVITDSHFFHSIFAAMIYRPFIRYGKFPYSGQKSLVKIEAIGEPASRIRHGYDAGFFGSAILAVIHGNELRRLLERAADGDVAAIDFNGLTHGFALSVMRF